MEKQLADLDGKIRTLNFRVKKTDEILQKDDRVALERHKTSLESMVTALTSLKESLEEKKFTEGENEEKIQEWTADVEAAVDEADTCMSQLADKIKQIDRHVRHEPALFEHKRAIALEKEKMQQQQEAVEQAHAKKLAFEKKKLELQQVQKSTETTGATREVAKMPKLVITKFDGPPQDWMRFWGQVETRIDKSSIPDVTKFSYLKEIIIGHKGPKSDRWTSVHTRRLSKGQRSSCETIWENQRSCGNVCSEHIGVAYNQREGCEENS